MSSAVLAGKAYFSGGYQWTDGTYSTTVDVYDAITSERPYKAAMEVSEARARIAAGACTHFDPAVVRAFLELLDANPEFRLPARVSPLPPRQAPHITWVRHDSLDH